MKEQRAESGEQLTECISRIPVAAMSPVDLRRIERSAQQMINLTTELRKRTPELGGLGAFALRLWQRAHAELDQRELRAARRERELFTVFVPDGRSVREVTRTARRQVTRWWRATWGDNWMGGQWRSEPLFAPGEPSVSRPFSWRTPDQDFRELMTLPRAV